MCANTMERTNKTNKKSFIQSEQIRLLYENAVPSSAGIIIIALVFWQGFQGVIESWSLTVWPCGMIGIAGTRLFIKRQFNSEFKPETAPVWARKFTINTIVAGIGWSVLGLLFLTVDNVLHQTAIIMVILGVMGASVPLLSSYLPAFICSSFPSAIVLPLLIYTQLDDTAHILTPAVILFIVLIYYISLKNNRNLTNAIALEYERNKLLETVKTEMNERKRAQQELEYNQQHLEMLVEERTRQLETSNLELVNEIEERKETQKALHESEQRLITAGKAAYDLIYEWDVGTRSTEWFGDVDNMLDYNNGEVSQNNHVWKGLIHPDDIQIYIETIALFKTATRPIHHQFRVKHKSGGYRYWSNHAIPLFNDNGHPYKWIGVCTDITEQKEHQQQLEHIAHYDILTNLPNRVLLGEHLQQELLKARQGGKKLAVAYIDLDGFKEVNDSYGHGVGDHFLNSLSNRLK